MLNNNQLIAVHLATQHKTGKFIFQLLNVAQETISMWRKNGLMKYFNNSVIRMCVSNY